MIKLIIVRHGNTFDKGDTILRVGLRTDLDLSESGRLQAIKLGKYFTEQKLLPDVVYCSNLKRTQQTAAIALKAAKLSVPLSINSMFNEIDYAQDDGKPENEVLARLGKSTLEAWDKNATVPPGWLVKPEEIINSWQNFAEDIIKEFKNKTVLVVTSNGVARFAPYIIDDFNKFKSSHNIKLATGAFGIFNYVESVWQVENWNIKPH